MTVRQLFEWWLDTYSSQSASHAKNLSTIKTHILSSPLAALTLRQLTSGHIETFVQEKTKTHAPRTVNYLRTHFLVAINCAKRAGKFEGANPAANVKPRKIPRGMFDYLREEEGPRVIDALLPRFRPIFAAAIFTGLRKGELFGLRKGDVDLKLRLLTIARSRDRETTKGGHADVIPIADEIAPYLEQAITRSPSDLVFPKEDGTMQRRYAKLAGVLRRTLDRAGIVTAYKHLCRRPQCAYNERA